MTNVPKNGDQALDTLSPRQIIDEIIQLSAQYVQEVPGKRRSWPESIRVRVLALHRLGVTPSKIADASGISRATIYLWLGKPGKTVQPRAKEGALFIQLNRPVVRQESSLAAGEAGINLTVRPSLRLHLPSGVELSGIESIAAAVELCRALGSHS